MATLIGPWIRERRRERGVSQVTLARRARLDQAQLSRIEQGRRRLTANELARLCEILGLDEQARMEGLRLAGAETIEAAAS